MKNKKIRRRIRAVLLAVVVICLVLIGREYALSARHKAQKEALLEQLKRAENERENGKPAKELPKGGQESEKADGDLADSAAEGKDAEEVRMGKIKLPYWRNMRAYMKKTKTWQAGFLLRAPRLIIR